MSGTDLALAAAILAGAAWLLVRSFRRGKGPCHGCDGAGCRSAGREPAPIRLGRPRAPAPGGE